MQLLTILSFVLLTSCILRPPPPSGKKFITFDHERMWHQHHDGLLINKVHEPHLDISYKYGDSCPPEARNNDQALTAAISKALRSWLKPLRDYSDKPIVADFRYQLVAVVTGPRPAAEDLWIVFHCDDKASVATLGHVPGIHLYRGTEVDGRFTESLMHEMGHTFGLADTYVPWGDVGKPGLSKGGLLQTIGTQPVSVMSLHLGALDPLNTGFNLLGKDDINGIIWLYKHVYENLPLEDCFFPEYELEEDPLGCRPKYSLIFAIKHGDENEYLDSMAIRMIEEDPHIDINARDEKGLTALHHAVLKGYKELVIELSKHQGIDINAQDKDGLTALHHAVLKGYKELVIELSKHQGIDINAQDKDGLTALHHAVLKRFDDVVARLIAHQDIKPFLKNADGHRALDLARQLELPRIVTLIAAHPKAMPVAAKGKQTTTWGELKKEE